MTSRGSAGRGSGRHAGPRGSRSAATRPGDARRVGGVRRHRRRRARDDGHAGLPRRAAGGRHLGASHAGAEPCLRQPLVQLRRRATSRTGRSSAGRRSRSACSSSATTATATGSRKPYGYSLYLAPFIAVLGPVHGVAVANTTLLAALMLISILLLRTRFRGPVVPLTVGRALPGVVRLHVRVLDPHGAVPGARRAARLLRRRRFAHTQQTLWGLFSFAVMGFGVSEKAAFVALFGPIALVMLIKAPRMWLRVAMPGGRAAVFAVAVLPTCATRTGRASRRTRGRTGSTSGSQPRRSPAGPTGFLDTTFSEGGI